MADIPPRRYAAFGLAIASELSLPELAPADRTDWREAPTPDLVIRLARLPASAAPGVLHCEGCDAAFEVGGVARFRVSGGREIAVDPVPGVSEGEVRVCLLGSALGLACHQRGLLPLHASAIVAGGHAVAFAGPSGAGKSTLAAHFDLRGWDVLADDICAVELRGGAPWVLPGPRQIKLAADAAARLGRAPADAERLGGLAQKLGFPLPLADAAPLTRFYVLGAARAPRLSVSRLAGAAAVDALMANIFRRACLGPMGLTGEAFALSTAAARRIDVFAVGRTLDIGRLEAEAGALARHFAGDLEGAPA